MAQELLNHRVTLTFVGPPPARKVALASGVTEVEVDGRQLRCFVYGSFQPFLEALHGSEVISLTSTRVIVSVTSSTKGASDEST